MGKSAQCGLYPLQQNWVDLSKSDDAALIRALKSFHGFAINTSDVDAFQDPARAVFLSDAFQDSHGLAVMRSSFFDVSRLHE